MLTSEASREFNVEGLAKKRKKALISEAESPWTEVQEAFDATVCKAKLFLEGVGDDEGMARFEPHRLPPRCLE